jgi:hypothetical protein
MNVNIKFLVHLNIKYCEVQNSYKIYKIRQRIIQNTLSNFYKEIFLMRTRSR